MKKGCCLVLVLILTFALIIPANAVQLDDKTDVSLDKVWTVTFNKELNEDTVNTNNIYIEDSTGEKLEIFVNLNENNTKEVFIVPKSEYDSGENYFIHITKGVKSTQGKYLESTVTMKFETESVNQAPIVVKEIDDQKVKVGEVVTIDLSEIFADPDGDDLDYGSTEGELYGNIFRYTVVDSTKAFHEITVVATDGVESVFEIFNVIVDKAIEFDESVIEDAVRQAINMPSGDIYPEDVDGITELELINEDISSVEGLQYLTGLEDLKLALNDIDDLTPLSSLVNLKSLDLKDNDIDDIDPLETLINLENLELSYNEISDITVLKELKNLKELDLRYNEIEDISALGYLENLEIVEVAEGNDIEDFSPIEHLSE